jgi:serine/threonine protein kinase
MEGAPLTQAAARLSFSQKAELLLKVTQAVDFLHQHGILNRHLKPADILACGPGAKAAGDSHNLADRYSAALSSRSSRNPGRSAARPLFNCAVSFRYAVTLRLSRQASATLRGQRQVAFASLIGHGCGRRNAWLSFAFALHSLAEPSQVL